MVAMFPRNEEDAVAFSYRLGQGILARRSDTSRKGLGQFLTPPVVARFMTRELPTSGRSIRVLDPAIGSAVLACGVIERAISDGFLDEIVVDGYEIDVELAGAAEEALAVAARHASAHGIQVRANVRRGDFLLEQAQSLQLAFVPANGLANGIDGYNFIIANPPYFKLSRDDPRVKALAGQIKGDTNIYALFMALCANLLRWDGLACFIVPRSFCSGAYFSAFRAEFIKKNVPTHVHIFESRDEAFREDAVLQENIIFSFRKRMAHEGTKGEVLITTSTGADQLDSSIWGRCIGIEHFIAANNGSLFFRLPVTELDEAIVTEVDAWPNSLAKSDLRTSTGPVVAFRAENVLMDAQAVTLGRAVPLLWLQHVKSQEVTWPVERGNKPQAIALGAKDLLTPVRNFVLLRRFSAKEERRRLIAAPLLRDNFNFEWVGLENHLNYLYRAHGELSLHEAIGLSALLNSALLDRYFRVVNGNTQVNAQEIRALPLPPLEIAREIGQLMASEPIHSDVDAVVFSVLRNNGFLPHDFPTFKESRFTMGKIQEAQDVLKTLGMPKAQQNEMAALTLLVLAQLSEETPWSQAQRISLRIHDILGAIKTRYGRDYAENTRETIRRQVLHQFEQAGLVERNPEDPSLPTNSPRTHYAFPEATIAALQAYGSEAWSGAASLFLEEQSNLIAIYRKERDQLRIPLRVAEGAEYHLSPGPHNQLQAAIIEEFGPRFAPGARALYVGDAARKTLHFDEQAFAALGIPVSSHDKLPDIVLLDEESNWLYLIEAVTTHGPISAKRRLELEIMTAACQSSIIFVTAFPDFQTFKEFVADIAWETEVWIADNPTHLIHFNGGRSQRPGS